MYLALFFEKLLYAPDPSGPGKFLRHICRVNNLQSGTGEIQGINMQVIYLEIWHDLLGPGTSNKYFFFPIHYCAICFAVEPVYQLHGGPDLAGNYSLDPT